MAASELHSNLGRTRNSRNEFRSSLVGTRSSHRPVLIVIAGPNGSGKTSVTSKILHHEWLEDMICQFLNHIPIRQVHCQLQNPIWDSC